MHHLVISSELTHHVGFHFSHGILVAGFISDVHFAVGVEAGLLLRRAVAAAS